MISNLMARKLRDQLIPPSERFDATVTLLPDGTATEISCHGCWWKPLDIKLTTYGGVSITGSERLIHIPAEQIGASEIRQRDRITVGTVAYTVMTSRKASVSTVWQCLVVQEDGV